MIKISEVNMDTGKVLVAHKRSLRIAYYKGVFLGLILGTVATFSMLAYYGSKLPE